MKKIVNVIGIILLVGIVVFGVYYLLGSTGIVSNLNPGSMFGQLIAGFSDALTGIQTSITGMFSNFTK